MSNRMNPEVSFSWKMTIVAVTIVVLCTTLFAGLWPFAFHVRNGAAWLENTTGLHFARFGTARGTSPFESRDTCPSSGSPFSLELLLEPEKASGYGTILAIGTDDNPESFAIRQSLGDIEVVHIGKGSRQSERVRRVFLDDVLAMHRKALLTITNENGKSQYFVDGQRIQRPRNLAIECGDLRGALILGTATTSNDIWSGTIFGIAAYDRALTVEEVRQHFGAWSESNSNDFESSLRAATLYLFAERSGRAIRDLESKAPNIEIPNNYTIMKKRFLQPFWEEFSWDRPYGIDLAVNIIGFIPLGICLTLLLDVVLRVSRPVPAAILLCFGTSLLIEVTQAYMPLRYSGTTDLITNTGGGAIGAVVYSIALRRLIQKRENATPAELSS